MPVTTHKAISWEQATLMRETVTPAAVLRALSISAALLVLSLAACTDNPTSQPVESVDEIGLLGFDHVGLVVHDLEASKTFFTEVLGFRLVGSDADYPAHFLDNGKAFVTLWRAVDPKTAVRFDRKKNVGLHHMALAVDSEKSLHSLYQVASNFPGVIVEFAPELFYGGPSKHMMIYEPSGNRIEVIFRAAEK